MQIKKRYARVLILSTCIFFAASCTYKTGSSSKKHTSSNESKEDATSSVASVSEESIESIISSVEESSSTVDPRDPNKDLKRKLSSTYKEYGQHNIANFKYMPSVGTTKMLVIPVWFTDSASTGVTTSHKADVKSDIQKAFFGTKEETGWNSVHSYYDTLSDGRLNVTGVVTDWWECGMSSTTAGTSTSQTATLVQNAVNWYFAREDAEPRISFDADADGHLDAVVLVYGAPDYSNSRNSNLSNLWAYCSWLQTEGDEDVPTANQFLWASYDFMYGSNTAYSRTGRQYSTGDTSHCTIDAHTFIHESGHLIGFNDYYDYSQQYNPAGGFSMQDENVGSHDPYSAMAAGWVDPIIPTESTTISLRPFQNENHDLLLLTNAWNGDNSPFDEYILVEFYTPTGLNELDATYTYNYAYPQGPSQSGLRIWHVDSRLVKGRINTTGTSVSWSTTPITNPEVDNCYLMQSNTSYNSRNPEAFQNYGNALGTTYADYNFLQLIKNDTSATYKTRYGTNISNNDLFGDGSSFNMSKFSKQFVNGTELNCRDYLGWAFDVEIEGQGEDAIATITLTRAE